MATAQPDGRVPERLEWFQDLKLGFFMHWGIYSTRAVAPYKEGRVCLTRRGAGLLYAIALAADGETAPPRQIRLSSHRPAEGSDVRLLGHPRPLRWRPDGAGCVISIPPAVRKSPPCDHA